MTQNSNQTPFVGKSRKLLVDGLLDIFDQVNKVGETRLVSLEAPSGWGKTRVIQEFYTCLASRQNASYWPISIIDSSKLDRFDVSSRRKRIFPQNDSFNRESGALPEFMWLGIACSMRNGVPSQVLLEDLQQFHSHALYLEAAWAALASFKDKRFPTLAQAKEAVNNVMDEAAGEGIGQIVEKLAGASFPGMGLVVSLGRWGIGKTKKSIHANKMISADGAIDDNNNQDLIDDAVNMVRKMAVKGLPMVIFVEDFHSATPMMESFIERLLRLNASLLVVTTTWPGEFQKIEPMSRLLNETVIASRIQRIRHDQPTPSPFHKGAALDVMPQNARKEIIRFYYPKVDKKTLNALSARYNNPLPLELVCTLPKYQERFANGDLKLTSEEVEALPKTIEDLYRELWNALPPEVQKALALATLTIPDGQSGWHNPLAQSAVKQCQAIIDGTKISKQLEGDQITHGWARVIDSWLRRFNEPDQLHIARDTLNDLFFQDHIDKFLNELAQLLQEKTFDNATHEEQHCCWLILALHSREKIDDDTALKAIRLLQKALQVLPREMVKRRELGALLKDLNIDENSVNLLDAKVDYAAALAESGQVEEALKQFELLLDHHIRIFGSDAPDTLITRSNIAYWLGQSGQTEEALKQFERLLEDRIRILGPDSPDTLTTRNNIASWLGQSGQVEDALTRFEQLLEDRTRILGPDSPDTLTTRNNIAHWLGQSGQVKDALTRFEQLLKDQTRIVGPDALHTLGTRNNIASWLGQSGQVEDALTQFHQLLKDQTRILGSDSPDTLNTRNNIAHWLGQSGQVEDALTRFEQLLKDQTRILGPDSPYTLITRNNIAYCLGLSGQTEEALKQHKQLLKDQTRIIGLDSPQTLNTRVNIAFCLKESGQAEEALIQSQQLLKDQTRILGPDSPQTLTTRINITFCLKEFGQTEEALKQSQQLFKDQTRILGPDASDTQKTKARISDLQNKSNND